MSIAVYSVFRVSPKIWISALMALTKPQLEPGDLPLEAELKLGSAQFEVDRAFIEHKLW